MPDVDTLKLINDEVASRLARQAAATAQVGTKAALIVAAAVTGTQFLATRSGVDIFFAVLAYTLFVVSIVAGIATYALARYKETPDPKRLTHYVNETPLEVYSRLIAARVNAFEHNAAKHTMRAKLWWIATAALLSAATCATMSILDLA